MSAYRYKNQLRTVIIIEIFIVLVIASLSFTFWDTICPTTMEACLKETDSIAPGYFLLLSIIRPFVFTPVTVFSYLAGETFPPLYAAFLTALGTTLSTAAVFAIAKLIGKKLVNPWLHSNLPQTFKFIRSQDWKIVLVTRLIPIFPYDLFSFFYGIIDFRFKYVLTMSFLGTLPEAYMFAKIADPDTTVLSATLWAISIITGFFLIPGLIIEFISRKKGSGLWVRLTAMWNELLDEVKLNNEIIKHHTLSGTETPVLLLYGFFSSRKSLTVLERQLTSKGHEVLSFNLGGVLGIFFTRGIIDTAKFIDHKISRQFERHKINKIQIVAHSKGGFVALWWLLKLGGYKYCDKVITMGTPFKGSNLTWLALITPLGFLWRDVWQMRPGSNLIKALDQSSIPKNLKIYCMYSDKDKVATGTKGIFTPIEKSPNITPVPMHHISHFAFLYRRNVSDTIVSILGDGGIPPEETVLKRKESDTQIL